MSVIMRAIKSCMLEFSSREDGFISASFTFPKEFPGFNGHFPGKPILPGVCKIQAVIVVLEELHKRQIIIKEVHLAKFFAPVTINERIILIIQQESCGNAELVAKVQVKNEAKKIADLHIKVALGE